MPNKTTPTRLLRTLPWCMALTLAACGGGSEDKAEPAALDAEGGRRQALAAFPNLTIPTDAHQRGMWGPLYDWPLVSVHAVLLPDGRVLSYGSQADGTQTGRFQTVVWGNSPTDTPATGHITFANSSGTDIFCSSQLLIPPTSTTSAANVFIAGGDTWTGTNTTNGGNNNSNTWSADTGATTRGNNMQRARWYSTSTVLTNGEVYIQGGSSGTDRPEVRATDGSFRALTGADTNSLEFMYPRNFVLPDGRLFGYDGAGAMYFINTASTGGRTNAGNFAGQYGSADASAAMYRPGRILQFGGNSNGAIVIDVTSGTPVVTPTQSMSAQRRLVSATILADGRVMATGGSPVWNNPNNAALSAEIWNPTTGQWLIGPNAARPRLYHSNALLLPDASVLITGGGAAQAQSISAMERNAQIYYPAYLFTAGGVRATRPAITTAPTWLDIGKVFSVQTSSASAISRVVLIKTGSATHNWNMEQRFVDLAFSANGNALNVQAPTRAGEATPGFYMLFAFNAAGVPSEGRILRMGVAPVANPSTVPALTNPGNRNTVTGIAVNVQVVASDPNGDVLGYSATGLPPGLSINGSSGLISGTPTAAGTFNVVAAVSDGVNSATANFVWTFSSTSPLTLTTAPAPTAAPAGTAVNFTAAATGLGVQFSWNFGDGSTETAWSSTAAASKAHANPGSYIVTLSVRDNAGGLISRSFVQTVYLAATANGPTASTNLLLETPASGNARLWVVNQDNNSVTAFDAVTRAKLGEVTVGLAPRAIARAANGLLWVTNHRGASISVIDPASRTVTRTIALPRASQPFGVTMSPTAAQAFVALSATGQLLKFDTTNYTQTASLSVGPNVRHVSVSGDGANVYVSRFITPSLPGEGTATVSTPATAGGEVLQVGAAAMTLTRTMILAHSERADTENQGRGIPNYLGAATISPDGTQAYVPGKLDNIKRGTLRDGAALNFQNTVRAASSRLVLTGTGANTEDLARRVDHDNASMTSAVAYDRRGTLLFAALETSREVAVVDAHSGIQLMRFDTGRAPQGLALSGDGNTLFVNNFMDRSVGVYDLRPLLQQGLYSVPLLVTLPAVAAEALPPQVLVGKQFFYDARDTRLARDRYMSCASCHNDGGQDGRTWDLSHAGEGLRNTISLRGRAGVASQGKLHWSANFDEVQDFEGQIRALAGGTGLMSDTQFNTGTRNQPLGNAKAGVSADLDALAAYVTSLASFDASPQRNTDGTLTSTAVAGKAVFQAQCLACHGGSAFGSSSANSSLQNIGTLKPSSGQRLGGTLSGIDPPTLRDVWATAPYLHDGSAATLSAAVGAHTNIGLTATQLAQVVAYVGQIGSEEGDPSPTSQGLAAQYFNNTTLSGSAALSRTEAVDFSWGSSSPGAGVNADNFSVRWSGQVKATSAGTYTFQTESDDGVRLWVNGQQVVNNWTDHGPTTDTSAGIVLSPGQRVDVRMEYYEKGGGAVARLRWRTPGSSSYLAIPIAQLSTAVAAQGLSGAYFNNRTFSGVPALTHSEAVDFDWGSGAPGAGVNADNFAVRWTGKVVVPTTGSYNFQTESDDGVRLTVGGQPLIDNWTDHAPATDTSPAVNLTAGQEVDVTLEYYESGGGAVMRLRWKLPGSSTYVAIPLAQLRAY